jgi:hypothetical protein
MVVSIDDASRRHPCAGEKATPGNRITTGSDSLTCTPKFRLGCGSCLGAVCARAAGSVRSGIEWSGMWTDDSAWTTMRSVPAHAAALVAAQQQGVCRVRGSIQGRTVATTIAMQLQPPHGAVAPARAAGVAAAAAAAARVEVEKCVTAEHTTARTVQQQTTFPTGSDAEVCSIHSHCTRARLRQLSSADCCCCCCSCCGAQKQCNVGVVQICVT